MKFTPYAWFVMVQLSAVTSADAFTVTTRIFAVLGATSQLRPPATSTSLSAGFASTDAYLSSLSEVSKSRHLSSSEDYVKSLAQFVDYTASTAASWEQQQQQQQQHAVESSSVTFANANVPDGSIASEAANKFLGATLDNASSDISSPFADAFTGGYVGNSFVAEPVEVWPGADVGGSVDDFGAGDSLSSLSGNLLADMQSRVSATVDETANQLSGLSHNSLVKDSFSRITNMGASAFLDMDKMSEFSSRVGASMDSVATALSAAAERSRDMSSELHIVEMGKSIIGGLQQVGSLLLQILDAVLKTVSGSSLSEMVTSAQASANTVVQGAIQEVVGAVNHIGNMSLKELAQVLVTVTITVTKTLWTILNAVVIIASGKTVSDWALVATQSMEREASLLATKAASAATDLSEKSLSDLVRMTSSFLHDMTALLVQGVHTVNEYAETSAALLSNL